MRILDILKARKLGYQTLHNTTDMLLAKKVSGGSYEDVTVNGNPISITGAKGGLVKALTVDMLPIQDLHGYDKPWAGGSGKNLLDYNSATPIEVQARCNCSISNDYTITISATGTDCYFGEFSNVKAFAKSPCVAGETYKIVVSNDLFDKNYVTFFDDNDTIVSASRVNLDSFTVPNNATKMGFRFGNQNSVSGTTYQLKVMVVKSTETDTTFAPYSNICPISGRNSLDITVNGKNLVFSKIEHCNISNGGFLQSYSSTQYDMHIAEVKANTTYTLKTNDNTFVGGFFASIPEVGSTTYNGQRVVSTTTFTAPIDGYVAFRSEYGYSMAQLEVGSSSTTYEPYKLIDTETISLGETVYGGTCDVVNGGTSSIMVIVDLDDLSWTLGTLDRWTNKSLRNVIKIVSNSQLANLKAEQYKTYTNDQIYLNTSIIGICVDNEGSVKVRNGSTTEKPHGKIAYELATPTTINTPATTIPLEKGNNTLSTSGDNMTVTYKGKGISSLQSGLSMMSPELTSMPEQVEEPVNSFE